MTTSVNLRKLLHRKAWENCTSSPAATGAGAFVVSDKFDLTNGARAFLVVNASSIWMYEGNEDAWCQLPNSGATGTFAAGACGEYRGLGAMGGVFTQTATAGSTTTVTTNRTIVRSLAGSRIRVIAGAGMGYDGTVASNTLGANAVVTVTPASSVAFDATTQYQIYSGSLWFFNSGTTAVGFSVYDVATNAWTARSVTGLPTAWGTDAKLISTMGSVSTVGTGTATGGTSTTLVNSAKAWGTNMWANYQVRITSGTGAGQIRVVASNTGTTLTVSSAWTVTPDATSTYNVQGNYDNFYLLGSNAVTMYRYTVSTNTWATLAPTAARAGAAAAGCTSNWIESAPGWDNEALVPHYSNTLFKQNGRYIFSFRGGASSTLDVYDIAANTWISNVLYGNQQETFTTGSSAADIDGAIFITKEATGRVFKFELDKNRLLPLATNTTQAALGGAAVVGDKLFFLPYKDGTTTINYMYMLRHSGVDLVRMLLI
jgi:hypothetical protein